MLIALQQAGDPARFGGKAVALARLSTAGMPVPPGVVLPVGTMVTAELVVDLLSWVRPRARYGVVVRSSALVEDSTYASYAGVFASCFAPCQADELAAAVSTVLASARAPTVATYQRAKGIGTSRGGEMAVLIQAAVRPVAAGVAFTSADGATRVEATWGLSSLLLAGHTAPDVLTISVDGSVSVRHIADKVLTPLPATLGEREVSPGDWITVPELGWRAKLAHADPDAGLLYVATPDEHARVCCVPVETAHAIAVTAGQVAGMLAWPGVDLEWVLDSAGRTHVVQARPVTSGIPALPGAGPTRGAKEENRVQRGTSASPGQASGPTHVHCGPARPGDVPAGHILVTSSAGPELMPALIACGGVIATDAGALCHTAIVARELGTPCVVGLHDAPADFPTGTTVLVDGTTGTVTILDPAAVSRTAVEGPVPVPATGSAWRIVTSIADIASDDPVVLAPDASALRQAVEDPELVSHWRAAGVVALLLPAGHPPLPGLAPGASQPDAGDLFWIAGTVEHDRPMLVVTTRLGEVLFHTDPLGRADQGTEATPCRT